MGKRTNGEQARQEGLAKAYQKTADEKWLAVFNALTDEQKGFLQGYGPDHTKIISDLRAFLKTAKKPSEFFENEGKWLCGQCILKRHWDAFLYSIDNCTASIFQLGWYRRSFRSEDYSLYVSKIVRIAVNFTESNRLDAELADILEEELPEEQIAYRRKHLKINSCLLAYEIDRGNERVIQCVKNALGSGSDTAISYELLVGVFLCKNSKLHDLTCRLLLAARLQEGLRQAICENADNGRMEPFLMIVKTIRDHRLIRYSSVKRAVGCWLGLLTEQVRDLERVSQKSLEILADCLEKEELIEAYLNTEDSMKIYIGLWAAACREFHMAEEKIAALVEHGTAHQAMTAGIFVKNLGIYRQALSVKAVLGRHNEQDVMAVFLPMMTDSDYAYSGSLYEREHTDLSTRYSKEDAEKLYDILSDMLEKLPKDKVFSPCVFPWNEERLTRADIIRRLCLLAADLGDNGRMDETCVKIPQIRGGGSYGPGRSRQIKMLLSNPKTEIQLDTLVSLACDKEEYSRKAVFEILTSCELKEKHFRMLENMLKYKAADLRQSIIDVLLRQPETELFECAKRLVSDKEEEKRTAGLDIIIRVKDDESRTALKERYRALTSLIDAPTSKEKILIERIAGTDAADDTPVLYEEADDFTPSIDGTYIGECKKNFIRLFPTTNLFGNKPEKKKYGFHEIAAALDQLIEEHKNEEYRDAKSGEICLLAEETPYRSFQVKDENGTHIAFQELWDTFYQERIHDPDLLFRLNIALCKEGLSSDRFAKTVFGEEYGVPYEVRHKTFWRVLYYFARHDSEKRDLLEVAAALGYYIAYEARAEEMYDITQYFYNRNDATLYLDGEMLSFGSLAKKRVMTVMEDGRLHTVLQWLGAYTADYGEHAKDVFSIRYRIGQRFGFFALHSVADAACRQKIKEHMYTPFSVAELILANYRGTVSTGYLYRALMEFLTEEALEKLSVLSAFQKSGEMQTCSRFLNRGRAEDIIRSLIKLPYSITLSEYEFTDEDKNILSFAEKIGETVLNTVLQTELTRGDTETRYSRKVSSIKRIYGAENFVRILAALGKDTLERSTYFYAGSGVSKKQSLSYLLGVCVPNEDDSAEKLGTLIAQTDVTQQRLVEAALYSREWMRIIEEYLGWEGFMSAGYYFVAHTSEIPDEKTAAMIAKYSPIAPEDFSAGAFDVDWFQDALSVVGEERFEKIYTAAKYISDGAKHTRARKYADAARGLLSKEEAEKAIVEKRNKDTLMAYALIPLDKEGDLSHRYLFIQEYKKQAKNFGAQRRASESAAADCALKNLSINAGFSDESRLALRMEAALFGEIEPLLDWNGVDDIRARLAVDENGKVEIRCEKDGRALKTVPAKYKKNELVIKLSETKKRLTGQYGRTRQMFEEAMEGGRGFTLEELQALAANPVLKPIVTRLVYRSGKGCGFLCQNKLTDVSGSETVLKKGAELIPAHPLALYQDGNWHAYQKYLFDHKIVQPFKQVFRELYIKTDEEAEAYSSTRYAGNQIQPGKTKACLKTRRWVLDMEAGLQKVYYKENVIASIYALADWFSPADIEAPTLEWVGFFERKTGKPMRIGEVPDLIFSEVMRDVDLAVSVAHAGGVDPETSHSTVEMRRAIVEFTLPLFGLQNVRLEKSHAFIEGARADYAIHLGSGIVHVQGGPMINVVPVHSQHKGRLFLPFVDDDPKTAQIISEILLFAEDAKIKDPFILDQIP